MRSSISGASAIPHPILNRGTLQSRPEGRPAASFVLMSIISASQRSCGCSSSPTCWPASVRQAFGFEGSRFDHLAVFLHEAPDLRIRREVQDGFGRTAQPHALRCHHDRTVDEDRVREHLVDELFIAPLGIVESELLVGRALLAQKGADGMPIAATNPFSRSRPGGVFRYSMTVGSSPLWRIWPACCATCRNRGCDRS